MTMEMAIRFPNDLLDGCDTTSALKLDGVSAIGQCIVTAGQHGTFFLQQHLLYVVLDGKVELKIGRKTVTLHKNEMILLRKYDSVTYDKSGDNKTGKFESLLFAIHDGILREFLDKQPIAQLQDDAPSIHSDRLQPCGMSEQFIAYCRLLEPYFIHPDSIPTGLLKLKMQELLYDVADCSSDILRQMPLLDSP